MITSVLSAEQIEKIHEASLKILETTGIGVPHSDMLGRLADSGARIDHKAQRVWMPADLIERLVGGAGRQFTLYGRDLSCRAEFGSGTRNYNATAGQASWTDAPRAGRRFATLDDVATATRFCDALDGINIAGAMADPHELRVETRCVRVLASMLKNTRKPLAFWFHDRASARFIVEMIIALRGDQERAEKTPLCYPLLEPISPLQFPFHGVDLLYETARVNMPVAVGPMAQTGVSAPVTLAGTMALENAEILAGICITQLVRPGMPVCYGGICHAFDMRVSQLIFGGPEQALFGVAMSQMGKRYGLPVYINSGLSDSKIPDAQAGLEIGVTLSSGAAAGADVFGHMGICGVDQAASLDMLVFQNEVISYIESALRPIEVSDETLGMDVIDKTGPGGIFIDDLHTLEHFRQELWVPGLLDRERYEPWQDGGAEDIEARCRRRKEDILHSHTVEPIAPELESAINEIVESAELEL